MKFNLSLKQLGRPPEIWLRDAGYIFLPNREGGRDSFARRLSRDFYPRFHIYFRLLGTGQADSIVEFNLHLDQKKPGYAGYNRHNAEYDGDLVKQEVNRLQSLALVS